MTALSRGNGRLHAFLHSLAGIRTPFGRLVRTRRPVIDLRDIPDDLRRDIGLLDSLDAGRGNYRHTGHTERERNRNWQRHLDRSIIPPV